MEAPRLERKLVAILAADVEGYSRHMERDEAATLATLSSHRIVIDELIAFFRGRITGTAGDSVLAEFASVVDSLDCAVKIQDTLAPLNAALPAEHRLLFRIGINVGDVMVKDGDIFGDGVNIAARLESLAEAGGICISRGVRDHVRKMGRYVFEDLGEQSVKNIMQPIRAFRVRGIDATAAAELELETAPALQTPPAALPVAAPPACTTRAVECPPSRARARAPPGWRSNTAPMAISSCTRLGPSSTRTRTASASHRPAPAASVSARWRSVESSSPPSTAATPPWAQRVADWDSSALVSTPTRRPFPPSALPPVGVSGAARRTAADRPATPLPNTRTSSGSGPASVGLTPVRAGRSYLSSGHARPWRR